MDEKVDTLICNLFKIIRNNWLQQSGERGTCLFVATSNDYVQTFRQFSLYYAFLQGGVFGTGPDKNELHLCKANQSRDPVEIATTVTKYTFSSSLSIRIPHLEGEKMFGSTKCKANLPPRFEANSNWHDRMNFSCLKVAITTTRINQQLVVDVGEDMVLILLSPTMVPRSLIASMGTTFGELNIIP